MGPSADFLDKLNKPVIPGTSGLYGNWVEYVCGGHFFVRGYFVGRCLVRRCTCLCGSVANVRFCISISDCCLGDTVSAVLARVRC